MGFSCSKDTEQKKKEKSWTLNDKRVFVKSGKIILKNSRLSPAQIERVFAQSLTPKTPTKTPTKSIVKSTPFDTPGSQSTTLAWTLHESEINSTINNCSIASPLSIEAPQVIFTEKDTKLKPMDQLNVNEQEAALIEDLLYVLMVVLSP